MSIPTQILSKVQIQQKTQRIAYQIFEDNADEDEIVIVGIVGNGYQLAKRIVAILKVVATFKVLLVEINLNKEQPNKHEISFDCKLNELENKSVIMIDDVLNSGKTMIYSLGPILSVNVKKVRTAVLVDRNHKRFPVAADFVGITLATTLQEHIMVQFEGEEEAAYLS